MKRLILMRHAKSSWDRPELHDHERPLAPRGRRAAPAMARWLLDEALLPDRVICSDAVRTRETWQRVSDCWPAGDVPRVHFRPELYLAGPGGILRIVAETGGGDAIMVVGHNPGMHDLARTLARPGGTEAHRGLAWKFPTAAVAVLDFDVAEWTELRPGEGHLVVFQRPKDLPRAGEARL